MYRAKIILLFAMHTALILPDAIFFEGVASPVQLCAVLVLPEDSFSIEVALLNPLVLPVNFTDGTAGKSLGGSNE